MIENFKSLSLTRLLGVLLFAKTLIFGVAMTDAWCVLVIFTGIQAEKVIDYLFPKRVDLYDEVKALNEVQAELQKTLDDHEHDITALKFSGNVGKK